MYDEIIKTEEQFHDDCECSYEVMDFVDAIPSKVRWFFNICYVFYEPKRYSIHFKSYCQHEYENFFLSIEAKFIENKWQISISKKIEDETV